MDMQAILKAGGIGAAILIVLNLLSLIPCVGCLTFFVQLAVYVVIGILAVRFMVMPRNVNSGATNGAVATLAAALVAGLVGVLINAAYFAVTGSAQMFQALSELPPEQLAALSEAGIDPSILAGGVGIAGVLGLSVICCGLWAVFAALLGAGGGAFWASRNPS